jgi:hypothetical protein
MVASLDLFDALRNLCSQIVTFFGEGFDFLVAFFDVFSHMLHHASHAAKPDAEATGHTARICNLA